MITVAATLTALLAGVLAPVQSASAASFVVISGAAAGSVISGNQLGWVTAGSSVATGVMLGPTVVAGRPGLGATAAVLASAHAGNGVGTNLTLAVPTVTKPAITQLLTVTSVTSLP